MSEESKRVLEIEDAADYTDTPIHEWSDGVIAEYRASAKTLARQVEALEAERDDLLSSLQDVLSLTKRKVDHVGPEAATAILNRARTLVERSVT